MRMKDKRAAQEADKKAHLEKRKEAKLRRRETPDIDRQKEIKPEREKMLIYCEGENTEPSYFKHYKLSNVKVSCFGEGYNTLSLVKRAIDLRNKAKDADKPYDEVWCVFDRDPPRTNGGGHSPQNFNEAIALAEKEGIRVAYSIQAFEYWLILHFNDHQGGTMDRNDYDKMLNRYLKPFGCSYDGKGSKIVTRQIFDVLEAEEPKTGRRRRELASERAERIYNQLPHHSHAAEESSTTVFQLVAILAQQ